MTTPTESGRSGQQSSRSAQPGSRSQQQGTARQGQGTARQGQGTARQGTARQGTARQGQGTARQGTAQQGTARQRTEGRTSTGKTDGDQSRATTVDLPFVTAQFHVPEMRLPSGEDFNSAANSVRSQLPSREDSMFYGGLAAGATFALIDWPVALAIGVGHALLSRGTRPQESGSSSGKGAPA